MRKKWIGLLLFVGLAYAAQAQVGLQVPSRDTPGFNFAPSMLFNTKANTISSRPAPATTRLTSHSPAAYRYKDLAFFCKVEVKLENAAQLPVKFRLGSVQYVDRLEGYR